MLVESSQEIFIYSPSSLASGGPEVLHQLGDKFRKLGRKVTMVYYPIVRGNPVHPNYKEYNLDWVFEVEDVGTAFVVLPEVMANLHNSFSKASVAIWWLSVDFYFLASMVDIKRRINNVGLKFFDQVWKIGFDELLTKPNRYHFYQSNYARCFLNEKGIGDDKAFRLTDYLHSSFFKNVHNSWKKKDIVAYNPAKGMNFTKKLMSYGGDIDFVPIINMSRSEVVELLKVSKVYIDFGFHPGKDRLPREAAYLGCCVIVGKRGSAANDIDVPIQERYKMEYCMREENMCEIILQIKKCFHRYEECQVEFSEYIKSIKEEESDFIKEVTDLLKT